MQAAPNSANEIIYEINDEDCIVAVNEEWRRFAAANYTPELAQPEVKGSSLWEYIQDRETRMIYEMMLARVRESNLPIEFSYRCDTPTCRRNMLLTLHPQPAQHVRFHSAVVREEPRPYVPLLDPTTARAEDFLTICSWCKRVELTGSAWGEVEEAVQVLELFERELLPQLSHGMCPDCLQAFRARLAQRGAARPT